jgi:propionyl-CoA carboxylase alpha chain
MSNAVSINAVPTDPMQPNPTPIRSVLVANRGEIARRIFRTAHAMGMNTTAVFVKADANAPFVVEADMAVRLDTGYLDGDAIIAAAKATGAQAIHPGYGFLSENADFARTVTEAGLIWIGPQPDVIATMGDKLAAKRAAVKAGVPTLPSSADPTAGADIGYPLLVKASAGGGGKGMRVVESADALVESVAAAQREALNGFGDDTVFLERYVAKSRHVEIQILGDHHGALVHLGERECSIQRRHQKIIEESPSPVVDDEMRAAMGDAAIALGQAMGYQSAGTVEFLVDDATREFFFLEVNTRLQVEHPVTEEVTGIDLVREQLRIAAGEPLGYGQDDVLFTGHAIEARLYAEDPDNGFLPAIGNVDAFAPAVEPAVRWDSGIEQGSVVGVDFDPMLAKVIAHAPTRSEAAARLALALERLHLGGVVTNRDFLAATLRNPVFLAGDTTTDFIERVAPAGPPHCGPGVIRAAVLGAMWIQGMNHAAKRAGERNVGSLPSGWRNTLMPDERVVLSHRATGEEIEVRYRVRRDGSFVVSVVDGERSHAIVHSWTETEIDVEIDGMRSTSAVTKRGDLLHVQASNSTESFHLVPRFVPPTSSGPSGGFVAPMPGTVLDVRVQPGDTVAEGDTLIVLEAMKMEHHMNAPADGVVAEVRVETGGQVETGNVLLIFEAADTET